VDPTSGLASIIQYCFPSTLFGGDPFFLTTDVEPFRSFQGEESFSLVHYSLVAKEGTKKGVR